MNRNCDSERPSIVSEATAGFVEPNSHAALSRTHQPVASATHI